jgi:signal transduction protein with GAF and PtsI domain
MEGWRMKKLIVMTCVGLGFTAVSMSAADHQRNTTLGYTWPWTNRLDAEINQLNRMRGHVRWQLHYYQARVRSDIRQDFARISRQVDKINAEFRSSDHDRRRLQGAVERARADLHDIETRLRVRKSDYYQWR